MRKRPADGFTLVEILMVILLVGIMSAVVLPQMLDFKTDAARAVTQEKLNSLKMALTGDPRAVANGQYLQPGYIAHNGSLPATLEDLRTQGAQPNYDPFSKTGWRGPYVTTTDPEWNLDGWKTAIQYDGATRTLRSCGPNTVCGDADDISMQF